MKGYKIKYIYNITWILSLLLNFNSSVIARDDFLLHDDSLSISNENIEETSTHLSPSILAVINRRPLFAASRKSVGSEQALEISTVLIDGSPKTVELVGLIESSDEQIAGFQLEGEETIWLQRDDHLGDWRVEKIEPDSVLIMRMDETRILNLRLTTDQTDERPGSDH